MSTMVSQITIVSIVCSAVCSAGVQRKHQSSASLAFVRGIHWWLAKGPVTRKMLTSHLMSSWDCVAETISRNSICWIWTGGDFKVSNVTNRNCIFIVFRTQTLFYAGNLSIRSFYSIGYSSFDTPIHTTRVCHESLSACMAVIEWGHTANTFRRHLWMRIFSAHFYSTSKGWI